MTGLEGRGAGTTSHLRKRASWLVALLLLSLTTAVYFPVAGHGFIDFDELELIHRNPPVRDGLTVQGAAWAFKSLFFGNWMPLTWLSHMADVQLYGLRPAGHHLTSLLLHLANTVLLFAVLRRFTGAMWRSAIVAAVFAVHPFHVEPVAWVAARRDLLSGFFFFLVLLAYRRYARTLAAASMIPVVAFSLLGMMSKPMLVTLPLVLLLLDYWPLGRLAFPPAPGEAGPPRPPRLAPARLLAEKIPLALACAGVSAATIVAQGRFTGMQRPDLEARAANAAVTYVVYLWKTVWPRGFSAYDVFPLAPYPTAEVLGAVLALAAISIFCLWLRRSRPFLATGWFFFLGAMVPVSGIISFSSQAMADRFTYLPLIGIFLMLVWGAADLAAARRIGAPLLAAAAAALLCALCILAGAQVRLWKDTATLFSHALELDPGNYVAQDVLGIVAGNRGEHERAVELHLAALRLNPSYNKAKTNLGLALLEARRYEEARSVLEALVREQPGSDALRYHLGNAYSALGRPDDAIRAFEEAIRLNPRHAQACNNLGTLYEQRGRFDEALLAYGAAAAADPGFGDALYNRGMLNSSRGNLEAALRDHEALARIDPAAAGQLLQFIRHFSR